MATRKETDLFTAVEIEINSACNMACSYCPNSVALRKEKGFMELDLYEKIMLQLQDIAFSGRISYEFYNEPLLHPKFDEIVKMTKTYLPDCSIHLYSNGTKIDYSRFQNLLKLGVDLFKITKHEDYDLDRKVLAFEEVLEKATSKEKESIDFKHWSEITLTNRAGTLPHIEGGPQNLLPCFIPTYICTITVEGNVLPCFEDFHQFHEMGNIKERNLLEIWKSKAYHDFRQSLAKGLRHQFKACQNCNRTEVLPNEGKM